MISVIQNNDVYEIRFPYDEVLLEYVRAVPKRKWHPDEKFWSIPSENLGIFLNQIKGTSFEYDMKIVSDEEIDVNKSMESTDRNQIPDIDISDVETYVKDGGKLFEHQLDCMRFAIGRKSEGNFSGFILSDTMGCGKSLEVINLALFKKKYEGAKHCLVICCMNSAKYNWIDEISTHTNGEYEGYLLGSRVRRDGSIRLEGSGAEKLEDLKTGFKYGKEENGELPFFLVTNIETLRTCDNKLPNAKKYLVTNQIVELINAGEISMIAVDEIHRNASPTSTQGKQLLKIKELSKAPVEWIPMTGTPIVNKPTDAFVPLKLVDGTDFDNYYMFYKKFCVYGGYGGKNIIGYRNIPQLKAMLEKNMLRRTKEEVLDLPPKMHIVEYVENSSVQKKLYDKFEQIIKDDPESVTRAMNPLSKLLSLRQVNGYPEAVDESIDPKDKKYLTINAKMRRLVELVSDIIENDEKVVIFSNWVEPLRTMYRVLSKEGIKVKSYTGTMTNEKREQEKHEFINDPSCKVLIGTIGALGTSHTLTVASNVIFYDEPWNAATQDQAEDRCHRAGSTKTVNVYSLITRGTVDEKVHRIIESKRGTSDYIVDDSLDLRKHPELLGTLVS